MPPARAMAGVLPSASAATRAPRMSGARRVVRSMVLWGRRVRAPDITGAGVR
jgi:hypothetical protein